MEKPRENISFETARLPDQHCASCGGRGARSFYRLRSIPVHSCLLVPSAEEAQEFPTGNLELAICEGCGFIFNRLFDPSVHNYSSRYEESQGFSACFNAFQERLVQRLVRQYDVRGKEVLEIGCGKGEFLTRLCEVGGNRGVGIDPSYVPGRLGEAREDITFIRDFYSESYADLHADFICCRHTLEHIGPVGEFLRTLRRSIGGRTETLVFFEVPDVLRVLREGAFWDIYYEHCSYFSCGSLARLFRAAGFELLELGLDFDGQYILLVARPANGEGKALMPQEEHLDDLRISVASFREICEGRIGKWRQYLEDPSRRAVAWGSGSKGVAFLTTLKVTSRVPYVVDINRYRQGKFMPATAQRIVEPAFLQQYRPEDVIVMNPVYCREIETEMRRLGLEARLMPV